MAVKGALVIHVMLEDQKYLTNGNSYGWLHKVETERAVAPCDKRGSDGTRQICVKQQLGARFFSFRTIATHEHIC